jgi:BolA family transcriptional regulator, general stress-responsive regulator
MNRAKRMAAALAAAFGDAQIDVQDESANHAGHAGAAPGGETHYRVRIVSAAFEGLSRVERHRRVNAALKAEFEVGLHALALVTVSPSEVRKEV